MFRLGEVHAINLFLTALRSTTTDHMPRYKFLYQSKIEGLETDLVPMILNPEGHAQPLVRPCRRPYAKGDIRLWACA